VVVRAWMTIASAYTPVLAGRAAGEGPSRFSMDCLAMNGYCRNESFLLKGRTPKGEAENTGHKGLLIVSSHIENSGPLPLGRGLRATAPSWFMACSASTSSN